MALGLQPQTVGSTFVRGRATPAPRIRRAGACLLLLAAGACRSELAPAAAIADAAQSIKSRAATAPVPAQLGDPSRQFLLQTDAGQIVLRSSASGAERVLTAHADASLYDPELELVWFRDGDRLSVLDLRKLETPAVIIARGLPDEDRFEIDGPIMVATDDSCDLPWIKLEWNETPTIMPILAPAPQIRVENSAWLRAELKRAAREVPAARTFSDARLRLPRKLQDCEEKRDCGATAAFGPSGLQLVRVVDKEGGDCRQRSCLLYDPTARLFATPARDAEWARAEATPLGSCGPFLFNQAQDAYLLERRLCKLGGACQELGGSALGWRVPGDVVGEPGLTEAPE